MGGDASNLLNDLDGVRRALAQHVPDLRLTIPPGAVALAALLSGAMNAHLHVVAADGRPMLLRIRKDATTADTREVIRKEMQSEMASIRLLHAAIGTPIPAVYSDALEINSHFCFLMEYMPGARCASPIMWGGVSPSFMQTLVADYAALQVRLSTRTFDKYGCLADERGAVGKMYTCAFCPGVPEYLRGPFSSLRDRYQTHLDYLIDRAADAADVVTSLETEALLRHPAFDDLDDKFYLYHGDGKGDHILADADGHITGMIDWHWTIVTSKAEAFAAQRMLVDPAAFHRGSNELSAQEHMLADAYERLDRPDLARCVRDGKKYQRLPNVMGHRIRDTVALNALRHAVTGESFDPDETIEAWLARKTKEYAADPRLAAFTAGDGPQRPADGLGAKDKAKA